MPSIVLEGVSKAFVAADGKSVRAVDHLSLTVPDRETLALVGPSGCGKTTTLRLIAGLETVDAGRILFDDQPVTSLPPVARDVALVFQSHALFPHLTAFDNLAFGLKLRRVSRAEIISRVRATAELLGIKYCLDRKPGQLSGGERQRVALGRAVVRRPRILLLDEPFSHLDEPLRVQMCVELQALRSQLPMTVVYVTHDQAEALSMGDRVAVLRKGCLQQVGRPAEIYDAPANTFVAGFIGSPPMNLLPGTVAAREGQLVLQGATTTPDAVAPFLLPLGAWRADWFSQNVGRDVVLGVRPERITPANGMTARPGIHAVVQSVQYLGAETVLRLAAGEHLIVARTSPQTTFHAGQPVTLAFELTGAQVYDAATGTLIF